MALPLAQDPKITPPEMLVDVMGQVIHEPRCCRRCTKDGLAYGSIVASNECASRARDPSQQCLNQCWIVHRHLRETR